MSRQAVQTLLFALILASTAWAAQQAPPGPLPPTPPRDSKDQAKDQSKPQNKPQSQGKGAPVRMEDTDAPPAPSSPEEDIEVAQYYIRKGDPDAAIPRLEEAIRLRPKLAKPRLILAEVYEKRHDAQDAVKCYKEYLQVFPTAPDAKKIERRIEKLESR